LHTFSVSLSIIVCFILNPLDHFCVYSYFFPFISVFNPTGTRNARNTKAPGVENDRILQILLNLIETLADDSLNPTRTQLNTVSGTAGSLGIAAITRFLVKNNPPTTNIGGVNNTVTSGTSGNSGNSGSSGLTHEPAWLPALKMPSTGITRQNSGSGVGTEKSGETDTENTSKGGTSLQLLLFVHLQESVLKILFHFCTLRHVVFITI